MSLRRAGNLRSLLVIACCSACFGGSAGAQGVELVLEPSAASVRGCDELEVALRVRGEGQEIGGYQVFLSFPVESFEILDFLAEPSLDGTITRTGAPPFGSALAACRLEVEDPWGDGLGQDVVAVAAAIYARGVEGGEPADPPLPANDVLLGRFVFRPRAGAPSVDSAVFSLSSEPCTQPFDQRSLVFDPQGSALPTASAEPSTVEFAGTGPVIAELACGLTVAEDAVSVSWAPLAEGSVTGVRVLRNDVILVELAAGATSYVDTEIAGQPALAYAVVYLIADGTEACERSRCEVIISSRFRRGDVNVDGAYNITDAVALLGHLFRSESIACRDAGDVNDDGNLNISDSVFLLSFLFRSGEEPPAPYPDPGQDPTEDDLDCGGGNDPA